jgi:dihydroorotate dehydrogenase
MPDWFYRTVTQPLFFRMPAVQARDFALGFMGRLARLPLGPAAIDFLGHMRADSRLRRSFLGIDFPTVVGLGPALDGRATALPALARFGFGFLDVGPVTVEATRSSRPIARRADREALWFPDPPDSLSLAAVAPRLAEASRTGLPVIVRLGEQPVEDCRRIFHELAPHVRLFAMPFAPDLSITDLKTLLDAPRPILLALPAGAAGLLIDGRVRAEDGGRLTGAPAREPALEQVRHWRGRYGPDLFLIASGGVHEPEDALTLRDAGADLVEVDSGVVYTGPGLPKRINEALLFADTRAEAPAPPQRASEMTWFWTALMGTGMLIGSLMALVIAMTRVVLPYDEAFVGMHRHELDAVNPRLLAFMAHDRVSLAGTMVAIGAMYLGLSLQGIRRGLHWAQQSVFISAFTGFASFFLFLGFGYLDTFHAFVTAILMQMLFMALHARLGPYAPDVPPPPRSDRAWRRSLWGQLLLVIHGFGLLGAGAVISVIGISEVFVPQDLEFMRTTAEALRSANPRLVPLVAHDRATLGGMLLASGWLFLLPVLWGFRNGSAWLGWTLLIAGSAAYAAALGIHGAVGYTSLLHLLPAFAGWAILLLGLGLSWEHLRSLGDRS